MDPTLKCPIKLPISGAKTKTLRILKFDIELHIHCRSAQVKVLDHLNPNTTNIHHYKKMAEVQFAKHQKVLAKSRAPPTIWVDTISPCNIFL